MPPPVPALASNNSHTKSFAGHFAALRNFTNANPVPIAAASASGPSVSGDPTKVANTTPSLPGDFDARTTACVLRRVVFVDVDEPSRPRMVPA